MDALDIVNTILLLAIAFFLGLLALRLGPLFRVSQRVETWLSTDSKGPTGTNAWPIKTSTGTLDGEPERVESFPSLLYYLDHITCGVQSQVQLIAKTNELLARGLDEDCDDDRQVSSYPADCRDDESVDPHLMT
jgi:hypothetical protein